MKARSTRTRSVCIAALGLALTACAATPATSAGSPPSSPIAGTPSASPALLDGTPLHVEVTEDAERLGALGIHLVEWGPDPRTGRERLTVQNLTPAKTAVLQRAFGADNIILTSTPYPAAACGCPASAVRPGPWPGPSPQAARSSHP